MPMVPFFTKFRDLAFREMRSVTLLEEQNGLPAGTYGFVEFFCDEPGCDCRYVFLNVATPDMKSGDDFLATINYGWENLAYYVKWAPGDKQMARDMKGPALQTAMVRQSRLAPALLDLFKNVVLQDTAYVERLKRHYRMFRNAVEKGPTAASWVESPAPREPSRNAPCPCGSGKKYKGCCGKTPGFATAAPRAADSSAEARLRERINDLHLLRYADRPPSEFLKALLREFPDPGAALARLAARDVDERTRRTAEMLLFCAVQDTAMPEAIQDRMARSAAPVLKAALKDTQVSDERKYHVGPLLAACGVDLPRGEYEACFRDFRAIAERKSVESMKDMSPSAEAVEEALEHWRLIGYDATPPSAEDFRMAFGFGVELVEHNPEAGAILLSVAAAIAIEHKALPLDAQAALELANRTKTPAAAWYLSDLATWPGTGAIGERGAELAEEMGKIGTAPEAHTHRTFSHGIVSPADGLGSRSLALFFRTPAGGMDALVMLVNDEVGLKDIWCRFGHGAKVEEDFRGNREITWSPISLPMARELVENALALHAERGTPPPGRFLLYRPYLGADPLRARKRTPHLGAYALEVVVRSPDLVDGSETLCEDGDWLELWFASDAAYAFVRNLRRGRGRDHRLPITPDLIDRFAREIATAERARLLSRLAVKLETEAWAGRAGTPMNRLAARTWLALSEDLTPFHEVPYVRALARRSLEAIDDNLSMGYLSQREANDAAMRLTGTSARGPSFRRGRLT